MIELRYYQQEAVKAAMDNLTSNDPDLIEAPTGAGKTHIIDRITVQAEKLGHQVLIVTPRVKLLKQTLKKLTSKTGVMSSILGSDTGHHHKVIIGTIQTLTKRTKLIEPTLIIIDEAHLVPPDSSYTDFLNRYPNAKLIGLTATPFRDNLPIAKHWRTIYKIRLTDLIKKGFLVQPRSMATDTPSINFDDASADLQSLTDKIVTNLTGHIRKQNRKKILVFARDIRHAELIAKLLIKAGEQHVFMVHSRQSERVRDVQYEGFQADGVRCWLINVNLVTIGVDIPIIDAIGIIRNITSFALLMQIIGRGLRTSGNKMDCLIYDFGNGTQSFGFIDDPILPNIKESTEERAFSIDWRQKKCTNCGTLVYIRAKVCPICHTPFPSKINLTAQSKSVQLFSESIRWVVGDCANLAIRETTIERLNNDQWKVEYRFNDNDDLFALQIFPDKPFAYDPGTEVIVKMLPQNLVEIIYAG
jgi:type I site-specific restriction endonuclease